MRVEKRLDDLWIGVKGQSNSVIAGSLRNSFRASLACFLTGVELLIFRGPLPGYQQISNSEYRKFMSAGVSLCGTSRLDKRETAQIAV